MLAWVAHAHVSGSFPGRALLLVFLRSAWGRFRKRKSAGRHAVAIPVAAGVGAYQPDRRLPLAQQRQGRRWQVQAATTVATGLTCFIFRFLKRPLQGKE